MKYQNTKNKQGEKGFGKGLAPLLILFVMLVSMWRNIFSMGWGKITQLRKLCFFSI